MNSLTRISALIAPVLVLALAACGEESPESGDAAEDPSEPASSADAAEAAGGDFCATVAEVMAHFDLMEEGMIADSVETAEAAAEARALLESAEPPAELADAWTDVTAFYVAIDDAFAAAPPESGKSSFEVLGDSGAAIDSAAAPAVEGMREVENHAEADCGSEGGTASEAGVCDMLTEADLRQVFGDAIPEPEDGSFGPEARECTWEIEDGPIVNVMYQARADFDANFLETSGEPRDIAEGIENGQVHQGVFGLGWFDTRGSSVYFTVGDRGGVVSVRSGEDNDFTNDDPIAIEFATKVVDQLS